MQPFSSTILIVEDNLIVAEDLRNRLNRMGYGVVGTAKNGSLAISMAREKKPDLILMDIQLGTGVSGIEAAKSIKAESSIPIIFLTAYSDDETIEQAKTAEPYGFVVKPFKENDLRSIIEVALYKQRADSEIIENRQWLETTLESIGDGVITTDRSGRVLYLNPVAQELTGWTIEEAHGKPLKNVFHIVDEDSGREQESVVDRVLHANGIIGLVNHTELISREGKKISIADSGAPIRDDNGEIVGVVIVFSDQTDRREAHQALEQNEKKLRQLFNSNPSATFVWERVEDDFKLVEVNAAAEKITDGRASTFIGMMASDIYSDLPLMQQKLDECYQSETPIEFEHHYQNRNQRTYDWIQFKIAPAPPARLLLYADVINEKKKAALALQEEQKRSQQYFEVAEVMMLVLDPKGSIAHINPKGCQILGFQEDEIVGSNWFDRFIPPTNRAQVKAVFQQVMSGDLKPVLHYVNPIIDKTGSLRTIEWHNSLLYDEQDNISGVFSSGRDVTETQQYHKALEESEARYRALFKSSSDAVFMIDPESLDVLDANDRATQLYGYDHNTLLKMKVTELSAEPTKTREAVGSERETIIPLRYHRKADKTVFPVEITASYVDLGGKRINISTIRDISEIKEFQLKLQQAQKMESIGNLAGGIAHDFNNILSSIIGFSQLAMDNTEPGSSIKDDLQEIFQASMRAKELVNQILTFARKSDEEKVILNINDLAQETLTFIRSSLPSSIKIDADISSTYSILASASHIHQVIMNLCTNGAQAMEKDGGTLTITVSNYTSNETPPPGLEHLQPGKYIQIEVSDTGKGIPDTIIDSIFEPYYTTKDIGKGTGIGLSVIHGIVQEYNGDISVVSKVGKGSTFRVLLPATTDKATSKPEKKKDLPGGSERVLFVDDEASVVKLGMRMLAKLGYQVDGETSSLAALERFRQSPERYDLVVSDVTMPELTGIKLIPKLREIRPEIPVILCTGYSSQVSEQDGVLAGANAIIAKPFVKDTLAKMVRTVLDGS
ncbi:MAG: PAS domain S-box protein [Desulfobulbaceae bacterium]|nr:MAG: PAS domain S-box protein [Desulfobulbaceae bacterium]